MGASAQIRKDDAGQRKDVNCEIATLFGIGLKLRRKCILPKNEPGNENFSRGRLQRPI